MSLINEALKKAQHQRTGPAHDTPPLPGGGPAPRRGGSGMPTGTLVLFIAGGVAVVVVAVVATVYFVNRPSTPQAAAPVVAHASPSAQPKDEPRRSSESAGGPAAVAMPTVSIQLPALNPPATESQPAAAKPEPVAAAPVSAAPITAAPAPAPTETVAPAAPASSLSDQIADYVDKVHVTGIRASGAGSKVLMNDKVYRLNDVVDRHLGLRLVKISDDSLTFEDAQGAQYVKNF